MTEVNLNETVNGYSGAIGRLVFRQYRGRTIVGRKPVVTKEPTAGQLAQRERFKEAAAFGKLAQADPELRAFYEPIARERGTSIYTVAVGDFLKMPSLKALDLSKYQGQVGDTILIRAVDDIGLASMEVKIFAQEGALIEQGSAVETGAGSGYWVYTATAPVALGSGIFIDVVGVDHARNEVKRSENPTVGMEDE